MESGAIGTFIQITDALREHSNELQLQQVRLLFTIAYHNAKGDKPTSLELSHLTGMPQGSVSRNTRVLSVFFEKKPDGTSKKRGLDLIQAEPDIYERRRLLYSLTPKGEKLMRKLSKIIAEARKGS